MSLDILDTDTPSLHQRGLPNLVANVDAHDPHDLAITVIRTSGQPAAIW
jgi:hypothetical protein